MFRKRLCNSKSPDVAKFHPSQDQGWSKILILSQILNVTQNFLILPNVIVFSTRVVNISILSQSLNTTQNFFANYHPLQNWGGKKSQLWATFLVHLKNFIVHRTRVWKISILTQIFNAIIQNFVIFAKFNYSQDRVGPKSQFWPKFLMRPKISWFLPNFIFQRTRWSKISNLNLLQHDLKVSWICIISWSNAEPGWSKKCHKFSVLFNISRKCQISLFACQGCSKMSSANQIYNTTQDF